jgi:copper(I)-binding protein
MVVAVAAALVTSACAAGQHAQTDQERATLDGTYASVGKIDLRGLAIVAPSGASYSVGSAAPVKLVLVNSSAGRTAKADQLVGITSPAASGWAAYATQADAAAATAAASTPAGATITSTLNATNTAPATAGESIASGASNSATATPSAPSAAPPPLTSVPIRPGQRVSWGVPEATGVLLLVGLKRVLYPGTTVSMTFSFADAGTVTVAVPVELSANPTSSVLPVPSQSAAA